jgi:hypothetical protein
MDTSLQTHLDALADRVITATGTIRQQLTALRPELIELRQAFKELQPGDQIKGCSTWTAFVQAHIGWSLRSVQVALQPPRPLPDRRAVSAPPDEDEPDPNRKFFISPRDHAGWLGAVGRAKEAKILAQDPVLHALILMQATALFDNDIMEATRLEGVIEHHLLTGRSGDDEAEAAGA